MCLAGQPRRRAWRSPAFVEEGTQAPRGVGMGPGFGLCPGCRDGSRPPRQAAPTLSAGMCHGRPVVGEPPLPLTSHLSPGRPCHQLSHSSWSICPMALGQAPLSAPPASGLSLCLCVCLSVSLSTLPAAQCIALRPTPPSSLCPELHGPRTGFPPGEEQSSRAWGSQSHPHSLPFSLNEGEGGALGGRRWGGVSCPPLLLGRLLFSQSSHFSFYFAKHLRNRGIFRIIQQILPYLFPRFTCVTHCPLLPP